MSYLSDSERWNAYEFSDPFATSAFFVCNSSNSTFCRPDCSLPIAKVKSDISFVSSVSDAISRGYQECSSCDPANATSADLSTLINCVATVNESIGFLSPSNSKSLSSDDSEESSPSLSQSMVQQGRSKSTSPFQSHKTLSSIEQPLRDSNISKNDADHIKIVDLACRHLASAAASALFSPSSRNDLSSEDGSVSPSSSRDSHLKCISKKKKRGGVLGFKELAAKLKLLAWHFHRVFKLVTGLTPKTYGDKCWDHFLKISEETLLDTLHCKRRFTTSTLPLHPRHRNSVFSHTSSPTRLSSVPTSPNGGRVAKKARLQLAPASTSESVSCPALAKAPQGHFNNFLGFGADSVPMTKSASERHEVPEFEIPQLDIYDFQTNFHQFSMDQTRDYCANDQVTSNEPAARPSLVLGSISRYPSTNVVNDLMLDVGGALGSLTQLPSESPLAGDFSPGADAESDPNFSSIHGFGSVPDFGLVPLVDLQYQHDLYDQLSNHASPQYRLPEEEGSHMGAKPIAETNPFSGNTILGDISHNSLGLTSAWSLDYFFTNLGVHYA